MHFIYFWPVGMPSFEDTRGHLTGTHVSIERSENGLLYNSRQQWNIQNWRTRMLKKRQTVKMLRSLECLSLEHIQLLELIISWNLPNWCELKRSWHYQSKWEHYRRDAEENQWYTTTKTESKPQFTPIIKKYISVIAITLSICNTFWIFTTDRK